MMLFQPDDVRSILMMVFRAKDALKTGLMRTLELDDKVFPSISRDPIYSLSFTILNDC
jgi:hypothetical protein